MARTSEPAMGSREEAQLRQVEARLREVEGAIEGLLAEQTALQAEREDLQRRVALDQRAPRAEWSGSFPWDAQLLGLLSQPFRLPGFRPTQREAINATVQGRDVLCLLPSGGGKSLVYQLPALLGQGLTLVVSPLLSLIHDQVAGLEALGLRGAALTSLSKKEETAAVMQELDGPAAAGLRLLYCTPERLLGSKRLLGKLEKLHRAGKLARVAIDEVGGVGRRGAAVTAPGSRLCPLARILRSGFAALLARRRTAAAPTATTLGPTTKSSASSSSSSPRPPSSRSPPPPRPRCAPISRPRCASRAARSSG